MGKKKDLSEDERQEIVECLGQGMTTIKIAKTTTLSYRQLHRIKRAAVKMPCHSSKQVFKAAGASNVPRTTRCRVLQRFAAVRKSSFQPPLSIAHKEKQLQWAQQYMKTDFKTLLFTDECRATLDGPYGLSGGWLVDGHPMQTRLQRQQGSGGVMFWAGIMGREIVGPFRIPDGVKMTSIMYVEFLKEHFLPWFKKKNRAFRNTIIFMHDNAPSHAAKNTSACLAAMGIREDKLMVWPPSSPDLNPIENLWSIIKRSVYDGGRQFTSKQQLWEAILSSCKAIEADTVQKLTNSMDEKLLLNKGSYIQM
ncbi:Transposable element Tc3 transposase [Nibea albiflora]|uniref:Transposable element Tc3 transposase n=1 Tax=Nibea albiflora TaxID=240163 RepID=A0ACB7F5H9_NIBAL|nr:Transposable element Tc3 transposase [Nibea albiflora]